MVHVINADSFYYNKEDRKFYFVNETSRFNYSVAEVVEGLEPDETSFILPANQFSFMVKKKNNYIVPEENLRLGCFYVGEFFEDNCADISVDYDNTNCKVVGCFIKKIKTRWAVKFAILLYPRKYITFNITLSSGNKLKKIYAYDGKDKKIVFETLSIKKWDSITKESFLNDYQDNFEVKIDLEFLQSIKDKGFMFKKWGDKK